MCTFAHESIGQFDLYAATVDVELLQRDIGSPDILGSIEHIGKILVMVFTTIRVDHKQSNLQQGPSS